MSSKEPEWEEAPVVTEQGLAPINPFVPLAGDDRLNVGAVKIETQRAIEEVRAAMIIAKSFPRNKALAYERVIATCSREDFAQSATYAFPRGGQTITGPSIRMAEELARAWGNIEFGIRELAEYENETEVEAYAWDIETNTRSKQTFRSPHERHTRQGVTKLTDPRDVYENNANLGARRMRSRILALIPPDVVDAALKQCRDTLAGGGNKPLSEKIGGVVRGFGKLGVTVKHIETKLGHKVDEMLPDEYADLQAIFNSLKDGQSTPSDWFAVPKAQGASEAASEVMTKLSSKGGKGAKEPTDDELRAEAEARLKAEADVQKAQTERAGLTF
jgi:hypothetical protein